MMKTLTTTAEMGSSTAQRLPRMMAPPMPMAVPMLESASER